MSLIIFRVQTRPSTLFSRWRTLCYVSTLEDAFAAAHSPYDARIDETKAHVIEVRIQVNSVDPTWLFFEQRWMTVPAILEDAERIVTLPR